MDKNVINIIVQIIDVYLAILRGQMAIIDNMKIKSLLIKITKVLQKKKNKVEFFYR